MGVLGDHKEGSAPGGGKRSGPRCRGKQAGGAGTCEGLLCFPVPGPGRDQKDNRVRRGCKRQTGPEVEEEEGSLGQREVEVQGRRQKEKGRGEFSQGMTGEGKGLREE